MAITQATRSLTRLFGRNSSSRQSDNIFKAGKSSPQENASLTFFPDHFYQANDFFLNIHFFLP